MDDLWNRLEQVLEEKAPAIKAGLAPGASEADIVAVETACGYPFPDDIRRSYLRHNGQLGDPGYPQGGTFIPCGFHLLPLASVLARWENHLDILEDLADDMPDCPHADPGVKPVFLDRAWVPIAKEIGANEFCLDFDPTPGGTTGQIVFFDHEDENRHRIAPDFRTWFETMVHDLETGHYRYFQEWTGFWDPKDISA